MAVKVLVTGVAGQLARSLAECSSKWRDVELIRVGRPEFDLEKPNSIKRTVVQISPDVVVSAAAYTAVDKAEDEPELAAKINGEGPGILARAAKGIGARLIHVSTDYVFDGMKSEPYVETDRVNPQSVYGRTKLEGEERVRAEHPYHIILRTAWVYSPFGQNFVRKMLHLAETRNRLSVVNDQFGNPTSALDLSDAIFTVIQRWRQLPSTGIGETYHCAGSGDTNWYELARHIMSVSYSAGGPCAEISPIRSQEWPGKAARPANSRLDCSRFPADFGWRLADWQVSVRHSVLRLIRQLERPVI